MPTVRSHGYATYCIANGKFEPGNHCESNTAKTGYNQQSRCLKVNNKLSNLNRNDKSTK